MNSPQNPYDEVPYPSHPLVRSHPFRTAAIARLFGLPVVNPEKARVLELGCASGGNLLPMAAELPNAEFCGIDLSLGQILEGNTIQSACCIENAELRHADICEIDSSWGQFDFIIAHGLYSWVPSYVQDHILRVCKENLSVNGIAYVSYNVFPGWHSRLILRDIMLLASDGIDSAREKVDRGRRLLDFVATHSIPGPYSEALKQDATRLRKLPDGYLFHEFLESDNRPVHFSDFYGKVKGCGLSYLSETTLNSNNHVSLTPDALQLLAAFDLSRQDRREEMEDLLNNRGFRESLLVHDHGQATPLILTGEHIETLYLSSTMHPIEAISNIATNAPLMFESRTKRRIRLREPIPKAVLIALAKRGQASSSFDALLNEARATVASRRSLEDDRITVRNFCFEALRDGIMDCQLAPWPGVSEVSEHPVATPLARSQAQSGAEVVSLRHQIVANLSPTYRQVLGLLDGSRDFDGIRDDFIARSPFDSLPKALQDLVESPDALREKAGAGVRDMLAEFARVGLLAG